MRHTDLKILSLFLGDFKLFHIIFFQSGQSQVLPVFHDQTY
jgi:hypothetical protein